MQAMSELGAGNSSSSQQRSLFSVQAASKLCAGQSVALTIVADIQVLGLVQDGVRLVRD